MRATEVCKDAAGLNKAVVELRQAVIRTVRTSTTEMDRRTTRRHQVDLPCRLSVPGQAAFPARLNNIPIGGAACAAAPRCPRVRPQRSTSTALASWCHASFIPVTTKCGVSTSQPTTRLPRNCGASWTASGKAAPPGPGPA